MTKEFFKIKKSKKKNVLIVGANGIIGSFLNIFLKKKYLISGIGKKKESSLENYYPLDLTHINEINQYSQKTPKYDALIFLVGLAHKKGKRKDLEEFLTINKQTLINLISKLDEKNKLPEKIIFSSSISIYGEKLNNKIYNEALKTNPLSPYAVSKLEAEEYLLNNFHIRSWILRFAPVYGEDFQLNINRRIKLGALFYKVGDGGKKLSLCNRKNIGMVIQGILTGEVPAGIYNISDRKEYDYNDLLNHKRAKWVIGIPRFAVLLLYNIGKVTNNLFLKENTIKLISDNLFPSNKIRSFIELPAELDDDIDGT